MEFKFSAEDDAFRRDLREFVQQSLPPDWEGGGRWPEEWNWEQTRAMRRELAQKGWLTMHWPEEYGGQNASPVRSAIYNEELAYMRAPGRDIFGVRMLGPTLMIHGSEEQKQTHLPPIARGKSSGVRGTANRNRARTWRRSAPGRCGMATITSSTERKSGPRWPTEPTGLCVWRAPTRRPPSIGG